jgi:hypothetical protein
MKVIRTDDLDNSDVDKLYSFLMKTDNVINKSNVNNIIWSVIYLRKIFNKSIKSQKSQKERIKYNYIITNNDEIICFFSLYYINKDNRDNDISIADLTVIIDKSYKGNTGDKDYKTNLLKLIVEEFQNLSNHALGINILSIYIPNKELALVQNISNNTDFELGFLDNTTYKEPYNVYYKHYISATGQQKHMEYSKGQIIELLMNQYGVNTIVNPVKDISRKLTRKSIALPELKVITKNIFDIKEIQDLPEYDYDYIKVYSLKLYSFFKYILSVKTININDFIMKRFFEGSLIFNKYIYIIYQKIYNFTYKNINVNLLKDSSLNINYLIQMDYIFIDVIENAYLEKNIGKENKLIITNSSYKINYFAKYKLDIIALKNTVLIKKQNNEIKKIRNDINICNDNKEFINLLAKNNKKYSNILISILYANYDFLIENINLLVKISYIFFTILNSIKYLDKNGHLLIKIHLGNINIPIIKKILNFIYSLFDNIVLEYIPIYTNMICFIKLNKFKGLNDYNYKIIEKLINILNNFEKDEFNQNEIYYLISSNKFTYKIDFNNDFNKKIINTNKKIFYDLIGFNQSQNKNMKIFLSKYKLFNLEYNSYNIRIANIFEKYNDQKIINDNIIKIIKDKYINLFKFIINNKLLIDENIHNVIKLLSA